MAEKSRARSEADAADEELEAVGRRIRHAVETGQMTAEEGKAKMEAYKKGLADKKRMR